jgi:hypothetical protein
MCVNWDPYFLVVKVPTGNFYVVGVSYQHKSELECDCCRGTSVLKCTNQKPLEAKIDY